MAMRFAALLLVVSWLDPSAAWSADPPPPPPGLSAEERDRFAAALGALKASDWSAAAGSFGDRAWASTPLSDYAALFEAQSLLSSGDAAGARSAAQRAIGAAPERPLAASALLQLANTLSGAGDNAGAVSLYRRFLARHGDHADVPSARLGLAQALLADSRAAEAARVFGEVWIASPAAPEAETAARQLKVLTDRGFSGPAPTARERVERAERLLWAGRADSAQAEAESLLSGSLPADLQSRALKIVFEVARRAGRQEAALAVITRALSALPAERRPSWLLELARFQKRKNREQALATLDKLAREYPKNPEAAEALLVKGHLLEEAAKPAEAGAAYRRLVAAYPDQEEVAAATWRLAWLAWLRGEPGEAAAQWARLGGLRGGQSYREAASYWLARADEVRGDLESAARRFAQIQGDAPRSYYGILAARRPGRAGSGRSASAPALPDDPLEALRGDADYGRVEALRAVGLTAFADEEMAELARRAPVDPRFLYGVSAAYSKDARYHLALRILRRHFQSIARTGAAATPRAFWEMYYPFGWRDEMAEAAGRVSVDLLLVAAVVREESSYYPRARSRVGARGLMQLMPDTARALSRPRRGGPDAADLLEDPAFNLELGAGYLASLMKEFGDARLAVAAYNAGPTRVREWWTGRRSDDLDVWVEQIPYDETRGFVKRVMLAWDEYRRLYGVPVAVEPAVSEDQSRRP
jgi:soluble lytic murein transglycosylase